MTIVSLSVQEPVLRRFDRVARGKGFASRSEAFRDAMREFVDEAEWGLAEGRNTVVLAVVYDKAMPKGELTALQHRYEEIRTMLHTHIDEVNCLEIFVAQGPSHRLKELIERVRRIKGVRTIKSIHTSSNV